MIHISRPVGPSAVDSSTVSRAGVPVSKERTGPSSTYDQALLAPRPKPPMVYIGTDLATVDWNDPRSRRVSLAAGEAQGMTVLVVNHDVTGIVS